MEDIVDSRSPDQGAVASEGIGGQEVDSWGKRDYTLVQNQKIKNK